MQQSKRRSGLILGLMALGLLAGVGLTADQAQAVDAVGPYYAEPAWDQKKASDNRFVVLTNWFSQAVLDKETGLVWEKATASERRAWGAGPDNARLACATRDVGGRKGWRLPSLAELSSLIDSTKNPPLPLGHPFTVDLSGTPAYWTATTSATNPANAWFVSFASGGVVGEWADKSATFHVWCVRGGMNAEAY